ncbi:hypothetical protein L5515_019442 [Caenorhabditis briggsae]|uniref:C2H2-type domain-containing protein n=1 Tax=Caenorhabditis briggsae TaxID=6238 RepID=A0AAE9FIE4_CAEBR|nr:hypothetical protein L5515_019442 [Caenorhabditis briggsae]
MVGTSWHLVAFSWHHFYNSLTNYFIPKISSNPIFFISSVSSMNTPDINNPKIKEVNSDSSRLDEEQSSSSSAVELKKNRWTQKKSIRPHRRKSIVQARTLRSNSSGGNSREPPRLCAPQQLGFGKPEIILLTGCVPVFLNDFFQDPNYSLLHSLIPKCDKKPRIPKRKFVKYNSSEDEDIENGRPGTSSKKNEKMKMVSSDSSKNEKQYEEEDADDFYDWVDDKDDEDYLEPEDEQKDSDAKRTKTKKMVRRDEEDSNDDDWEDEEDDDVSVNQPTTSKGKIIEKDSSDEDEIDIGRAGTTSQQMKTKKKRVKKMKVVYEYSDDFCWKDDEKDGGWVKHVPKEMLTCPDRICEIKLGYPSDLRKHLTRVHFSNLSGKKLKERVRAACEEWIKARKLILEKANSKGIEKAPKDLKCCCEVLDLPYNVSNLYRKGSEVCRIRPKERYFGLKRKGPEGAERQYWCNNCFQEAKKDRIVDVNQFVSMQNKRNWKLL